MCEICNKTRLIKEYYEKVEFNNQQKYLQENPKSGKLTNPPFFELEIDKSIASATLLKKFKDSANKSNVPLKVIIL